MFTFSSCMRWLFSGVRLRHPSPVIFASLFVAISAACVIDSSTDGAGGVGSKRRFTQNAEAAEYSFSEEEDSDPISACSGSVSPGYYVAVDGVNASDRGTKEAPWRTIGYALKHLQAGDTLYIRGGVYYERKLGVHLTGTEEKPIVIEGYPCERVVIDAGFPEFRDVGNQDWEPVDPILEEWRSIAPVNLGDNNELVFGFIVDVPNYRNGRVRLVPYQGPDNFRAINEMHAADENDPTPIYVGPGVWRDPVSGHIHIRLTNSFTPIPFTRDPRELTLHLSTALSVLEISGSSYVNLRNLTLQNARRAIDMEGVNRHIVFDKITTWALSGIFVSGKIFNQQNPENAFISVTRSRFYNDHPEWIHWSDVKRPHQPRQPAGVLETGAIRLHAGSHDWDIGWNHFRGGFDGPSQNSDAHSINYHHNLIEAYGDDGFELEGGCVNSKVYENHIRQTLTGIAMSPCLVGPVYVYRNVIANLDEYRFRRPDIVLQNSTRTRQIGSPFKFTEYKDKGAHPTISVYQNTVVYLGREGETERGVAWVNHQVPDNFMAFNNIGYVVNGVVAGYYGAPQLGQQIDGNLYFKANPTDGANLLQDIAGSHFPSLEAFRSSAVFEASKESYPLGWEANGFQGDPLFSGFFPTWDKSSAYWQPFKPFMDWPVHAFYLRAESPARVAGMALPEELPDTRRPPFSARPDIGAIPYGEAFPIGPDASHQNTSRGIVPSE